MPDVENNTMSTFTIGGKTFEIEDGSARSNIQTINTVLDTKADTSDITVLDTRVTNVGDALADKADADDLDAIDGRVTALESGSGGGGGPTNMANGSASGSVRGINTASEDSSYTMGNNAHAEGSETKASGENSHAECGGCTAKGTNSHAEGGGTTASGMNSHAEGTVTTASRDACHAEGYNTRATGYNCHAEGANTQATGSNSHAEGLGTIAQGYCQHVSGMYNYSQGNGSQKEDSDYAVIVGNGTSPSAQSNAFAMKWDGTFVFANGTEITPAQFTSLLALLNN